MLGSVPHSRHIYNAAAPRVRAFPSLTSRAATSTLHSHSQSRTQHGCRRPAKVGSRRALSSTAGQSRHHGSAVASAAADPMGYGSISAEGVSRGPSPQEGRAQMLQSVVLESFKIAGVSFEDRQDLVKQLTPDQALMMVKEPDNAYDPNALAVQTLDGQTLGYVPKEHIARFPHDITFGHVYSLGPNALGLWGVTVAVRPGVMPLTIEAFPVNLASHVNLSSNLEEAEWNEIRKAVYEKANYRCDISGGVGVEWPVECHEVWRFHNGSATLQLMGFAAVHPEVHVAKHLERQQDDKRRQQAIWMLQSMNQWTVSEAEQYCKYARQTAFNRSSQQWKFDLSWLTAHGFRIPTKLQPFCRT